MTLKRVIVMGLGKVGTLVATLLHESQFEVTGLDAVERKGLPFATKMVDLNDPAALRPLLKDADALVSCLPFHLNIAIGYDDHQLRNFIAQAHRLHQGLDGTLLG